MDGPFNEVADEAEQYIKVGATVYFKFTCEHCGSRQTFTERNTLYETGDPDRQGIPDNEGCIHKGHPGDRG